MADHRKRLITSIVVVILCTLVTSCDRSPHSQSQASFSVQVTDYKGNIVKLEQPAETIVALAPHIVENVFTAGSGSKLVGVSDYSDFPKQASNIPIVSGFEKINFEKIIELNPDLILVWQTGNPHSGVDHLRSLGFKIYVDEPHTLQDIAKSIQDIGILGGTSDIANKAAQKYLDELNKIIKKHENHEKITSFYQVWNSPLQTLNGEHIISNALEACGGINIYQDEFAIAPTVNLESVIERDPQVIFAGQSTGHKDFLVEQWKQWPNMQSVKNNHLFYVHADHIQRHSVRILYGVKKICEYLQTVRQAS